MDTAGRFGFILISVVLVFVFGCGEEVKVVEQEDLLPILSPGVKAVKLAGGFSFTEGPAADKEGNVYFTDIPNNRIHKWSVDGQLSVFKTKTGGANGLFFDAKGNLLACQGDNGMIAMYPMEGTTQILADEYKGNRFNKPNDLWVDPKGGIYFTDPMYGDRSNLPQGGEHVYYIKPGGMEVIRVVDDMVRPNGIIGTPDGKILYIADHGGGETYRYRIKDNGLLADKKLFCGQGSDGVTLDERGNLYLTAGAVSVYNPAGEKILSIEIPEGPANVCFGGKEHKTLFVTARTSLYSVETNVKGAY